MPSEISQRQKDKYCMILYVESKKVKCIETEGRMVVTRGWEGSEKWGDVGQRCTLRYKMNNFRRPNIQHGDCS